MLTGHTILLADDHPLFRQGLRSALTPILHAPTWYEAASEAELLPLLTRYHEQADLILLDLLIPGAHGFSTLIYIRQHYPSLPVMMVSGNEAPETIRQAIYHGASGFMPKSLSPEKMGEGVQQVLSGALWVPDPRILEQPAKASEMGERIAQLTPQQHRILLMFAEGMLNKQIAYDLHVSEATIKAHATAIFRKLGVRNRTQAVIALGHIQH